MFITVPASIGIMALAQPLFTVFYGFDPVVHGHDPNFDGSRLLFYYAPVAILISLLSVTASMLQVSINKTNSFCYFRICFN